MPERLNFIKTEIKMNVTIVCEVLGKANNGTTVAALNLIRSLKEKGHNVKVICPDADREGLEGYYILPVTNMGSLINGILDKNHVTLAKYDEQIIYDAIKDADVVHFMVPLFIARRATKLAASLGKPITAGFHAQAENLTAHIVGLMGNRLANHLTYEWYDKNLFCRADAIHYPTQFIRDVFESEVHRKTNGYVISNGVCSDFHPVPAEKPEQYRDKFCILFTGRLSKEKSHIVLMKAVRKSKYADKIQLFFAGNGPLLDKIEKYGKKHLKNPPVIGFYSRAELVDIINFCDLYCHPAEIEIEAIACLEAIACGLVPVIANSPRCATKAFALDERCLFEVNNPDDLAKKIDYFIEHPEEKAALRERYLSESVTFDQKHCMDMMEQMLLDQISKKDA